MGEALANAIDAMAAIKQLVYEAGTVTMAELLSALDADWIEFEGLRQLVIRRASKFANDDACADDIGREMIDHFVRQTRAYAKQWYPRVIFPASLGTFSWVRSTGYEVDATPDGRHARDAVAANLSPVPGSDRSGPIAAIASASKMRPADMAGGAPLDLRLSKSGLAGEGGTQRLAALVRGFLELGGNMLVLTVTDVEDLKRAMVEPDKYRGLRVRMGGWSAYFVMLSKQQQLLHIDRVEHGLA
jgi:formate C-acetyltransferase